MLYQSNEPKTIFRLARQTFLVFGFVVLNLVGRSVFALARFLFDLLDGFAERFDSFNVVDCD